MSKVSMFKFLGEILPRNEIPPIHAGYSLTRKSGSVSMEVEGSKFTIEFVGRYESFEEIYAETKELIQSFLSVQSLQTGLALSFIITEWIETPLEPLTGDGISRPVKGKIYHEKRQSQIIPEEIFTLALAEGINWIEDMEWNPFLRRAVMDFNYALQQAVNDVPIYLYRAVESAQVFFGGELPLIDSLDVHDQVKIVKKLANDAQGGLHVRHAAKTSERKNILEADVIAAVTATQEILEKFQRETWSRRVRENPPE